MLCQQCKKNEATTFYQENVNGHTRQLHLCAECASNLTSSIPSFGWLFGQPSAFFSQNTESAAQAIGGGKQCSTCGMTESTLRRTGRVGCAACYKNFNDILLPYIKKLHGSTTHVGISPAPDTKTTEQNPIQALKTKLSAAVQAERYEEAAQLRDEIRRLEEGAS